jgi:hypothetical protein
MPIKIVKNALKIAKNSSKCIKLQIKVQEMLKNRFQKIKNSHVLFVLRVYKNKFSFLLNYTYKLVIDCCYWKRPHKC